MYRSKPKLSVSIAAAQSTVSRPSLSLKSPGPLHSPRSPLPPSPAAPASKRFSTIQVSSQAQMQMQVPSYNYVNSCSSKSILKKQAGASASGKRIQFQGNPTVHCITPIENRDEYYGNYTKLSKEERRWIVRQ
ncbi:hypothetical protein BDW59DRAFT_148073 [Aspergillus cavernicola]|uniref:Uncharacterized protein n=1 Tax=Aspergillus cavernicola TaxID=176166 RepID=A0ABR4I8E5_9EURO